MPVRNTTLTLDKYREFANVKSSVSNALTATPANPAGTTSTVGVMAGLGIQYTPMGSGVVKVIVSGFVSNNTAGDSATVKLAYGTGTPPTNGAALAGTAIGNSVTPTVPASTSLAGAPFTIVAVVALAPRTTYWFDLQQAAVTGGTASVSNLSIVIEEV